MIIIFGNLWYNNQSISGGGGNYVTGENKVGSWVLFNNTGESACRAPSSQIILNGNIGFGHRGSEPLDLQRKQYVYFFFDIYGDARNHKP
jgi:hypothetical protein